MSIPIELEKLVALMHQLYKKPEINPYADEHTIYAKYKGSDDWVPLTTFDMK